MSTPRSHVVQNKGKENAHIHVHTHGRSFMAVVSTSVNLPTR